MTKKIDMGTTEITFIAIAQNAEANFLLSRGFQHVFCNQYAFISTHRESGQIVCVLLEEYVPIDRFKYLFTQISSVVKSGNFNRFIFDKRSLRTFHQPTMEWYFLEWKQEMTQYGLKQHFKILPKVDWFVKAVEVAREPLIQKLSAKDFAMLDIRYCNSLDEAIAV